MVVSEAHGVSTISVVLVTLGVSITLVAVSEALEAVSFYRTELALEMLGATHGASTISVVLEAHGVSITSEALVALGASITLDGVTLGVSTILVVDGVTRTVLALLTEFSLQTTPQLAWVLKEFDALTVPATLGVQALLITTKITETRLVLQQQLQTVTPG